MAIVTVPYEYEAATPIIGTLLGTIQMEGESQFKVDFNCEGPECPMENHDAHHSARPHPSVAARRSQSGQVLVIVAAGLSG